MTDVDARAREALELEEYATPSPWETARDNGIRLGVPGLESASMRIVWGGTFDRAYVPEFGNDRIESNANAALIARYRTLCPALARDVQRLRRIEELAKDAAPLMSCTSATRAECPACKLRHALAVEEESCDCPIHGRQLGTVCPRC
jgi:hypothetical protein